MGDPLLASFSQFRPSEMTPPPHLLTSELSSSPAQLQLNPGDSEKNRSREGVFQREKGEDRHSDV